MAGYTKLFSSIVHSTIWRAENHVRLVWVTMLAMSDKNGLVESSIPGLADAARVSLEECEAALKQLTAPDPYSRSKDFDGRRIQDADGGWELLNYVKYRGKLKSDTVREQGRMRQQKYRKRQKEAALCNVTVTHNADVTPNNAQSESESDPDPESDPKKDNKDKKAKYSKEFLSFWDAYPRKVGKRAANKAWQRAIKLVSNDCAINEAVEAQKKSAAWLKDNGQYIPYPATWLNQGRWEDETEPDLAKPIEVDKEYEEAMATFKFK